MKWLLGQKNMSLKRHLPPKGLRRQRKGSPTFSECGSSSGVVGFGQVLDFQLLEFGPLAEVFVGGGEAAEVIDESAHLGLGGWEVAGPTDAVEEEGDVCVLFVIVKVSGRRKDGPDEIH